MVIFSGIAVMGLVAFMLFSPLSLQFTEECVRGSISSGDQVSDIISQKELLHTLDVVDSTISSKEKGLPRFAYLDRFLDEDERIVAANARADIYELQWRRIGLLKVTGDQASLVDALRAYSRIIGYNQAKAEAMLHSITEK